MMRNDVHGSDIAAPVGYASPLSLTTLENKAVSQPLGGLKRFAQVECLEGEEGERNKR